MEELTEEEMKALFPNWDKTKVEEHIDFNEVDTFIKEVK